jgi:penicillin-binding protein 1C
MTWRWSMLLAGIAALAGVAFLVDRLMPPDLARARRASVVVTDDRGGMLRPFLSPDGYWRLPTSAAEVDPLYLAMLMDKEDRRFGRHPGVDGLAVARAAGQWLRHGRMVSGASTITMQAARLLEPKPRDLAAKLTEMARAVQLQARLGGNGVLDLYLTLAPFGGNLEGVRAASLGWFGKEPARLAPAEAALLAALPQSPERLRPDRHPEAARAARNRILDRAAETGLLAAEMVAAAKAMPVPARRSPMPRHAAHLAELLARGAGPGQTIRTHVNADLQRRLEELGRDHKATMADGGDVAVVVVSNHDRAVIAHLGSGDWESRPLDLSRARRSPGSALKPFVYALAFDQMKLHPGTLVQDGPVRFGDWSPRNFDHGFRGLVTVREALQRSLNVPAVLALERVGPGRMAATLAQAGAALTLPKGGAPRLTLALGGVGISPMDLTMLYAALANGGRSQRLSLRAGEGAGPVTRLVNEAAAWAVLDILQGTTAPEGYAMAEAVMRRPIAYKTGTSHGFRDAWAMGASPDYTIGIWTGLPQGGARPGQLGRVAAAPLLFKVFELLPPDQRGWKRPGGQDNALLHRQPPRALVRLVEGGAPAPLPGHSPPPQILFPPNGAVVETMDRGIALSAQGGRAPLRWLADGQPLPAGARFWQPQGSGFSRLVVVDADGNRAAVTVQVVLPGAQ